MSAEPVEFAAPADGWDSPPAGRRPRAFVADPPTDLSGPSDTGFTPRSESPHGTSESEAKSPHGISRTGIVLLDERPPSTGRPAQRPASGRRRWLDTVIAAHPWLGTAVDRTRSGGYPAPRTAEPGPVARAGRRRWGRSIRSTGSRPRAYGHGTFIAGIVRQLAPEARILSLPVMSEPGTPTRPRCWTTSAGCPSGGYARTRTRRICSWTSSTCLSAGIPTTRDTEFPAEAIGACWTDSEQRGCGSWPRPATAPPQPGVSGGVRPGAARLKVPETALVSVGALDPNGELAAYSNSGDWVRSGAGHRPDQHRAPDDRRGPVPDLCRRGGAPLPEPATTRPAASPAGAAPPSPPPGSRPRSLPTCSTTHGADLERSRASKPPTAGPPTPLAATAGGDRRLAGAGPWLLTPAPPPGSLG